MAVEARFPMMWLIWTMMLSLSSTLHGCDKPAPAINGTTAEATIAGKKFSLKIAAENAVRMRGLGGFREIAEDGGMIFVFPRLMVGQMGFVMRDCPIDIDIMYLDGAGKVLTTYEMKAEPPRGQDEGKDGDMTNTKYENRLKQYDSRFATTFVIELKAGTIKKLGVKENDVIEFDRDALKRMAK
jgi:hypothetical protein